MARRLVLFDGTALVYRSYYAIPSNLRTSAGLLTNAIYGFALSFKKLLSGRNPDCGAVIFDAPGKTFRDEAYPEYKADRAPMLDELGMQLPYIDRLVEVHAFPRISVPGFEADDVIGTLTSQALAKGFEVLIVSGDKDFAQLIGPRVRMLDPIRDITYDEALVQKKWGVPPERFVDLLALMGDKIDNIPGVPGIGAKGAAKMLEAHGSLEGVLANLDALSPRYAKALAAHVDDARLSQKLATIDRSVPLEVGLDDLGLTPPDPRALDTFYRELEFFSLLSASGRVEAESEVEQSVEILDASNLEAWLEGANRLAIAPAADGEHPAFAKLVGLALAKDADQVAYVDVREGVPGALAGVIENPAISLLAHDCKRLRHLLVTAGLRPTKLESDTMVASFLVDPTKVIPHRLEQVTREYLQYVLPEEKRLLGGGKSKKTFAEVPPSDVAALVGAQARAIWSLWATLEPKMEAAGQFRIYAEQEQPLGRVLFAMEREGILVDAEDLGRIGEELGARLAALEQEIHGLAGHAFNVASTKQLATVLFEELGLPVVKRTKTGYSTASDVLERLAPKHDIANKVLEHRQISKLISTYTNVLQAAVRPETGRIHATFQQTVGATGRLISTDPDLQRTPIRTPEGKRIRRAFIAKPGCKLISADWSQIELRLLAHVSADPELMKAFAEGADVHARTAAALFGVTEAEVDEARRRVGKTVNFATIYGQGATALGQILGISRSEAQGHIDAYFARYRGVREWLERTTRAAKETGEVKTLIGRRRVIPELFSNNFMDQQAGLRIAANTPIQGSAADLCKQAMLRIQSGLESEGLRTRLLLQVHDELVFEAPEGEVDAVCQMVRKHMQDAIELSVPLRVDIGVGDTWEEAH